MSSTLNHGSDYSILTLSQFSFLSRGYGMAVTHRSENPIILGAVSIPGKKISGSACTGCREHEGDQKQYCPYFTHSIWGSGRIRQDHEVAFQQSQKPNPDFLSFSLVQWCLACRPHEPEEGQRASPWAQSCGCNSFGGWFQHRVHTQGQSVGAILHADLAQHAWPSHKMTPCTRWFGNSAAWELWHCSLLLHWKLFQGCNN